MTQEQINVLVQQYLTTTLDSFEDWRIDKGSVSDEVLEGQWLVLSDLLDATVEQLTDHDYRKISPTVDELLFNSQPDASEDLTNVQEALSIRPRCPTTRIQDRDGTA